MGRRLVTLKILDTCTICTTLYPLSRLLLRGLISRVDDGQTGRRANISKKVIISSGECLQQSTAAKKRAVPKSNYCIECFKYSTSRMFVQVRACGKQEDLGGSSLHKCLEPVLVSAPNERPHMGQYCSIGGCMLSSSNSVLVTRPDWTVKLHTCNNMWLLLTEALTQSLTRS